MKNFLLWLWQLPQHLLALIIWRFLKSSGKIISVRRERNKRCITVDVPSWGVSLGQYVFMDQHYEGEDWNHEFGHSKQSLYCGWLYLLIIGIPSAVFNNLWDRLFHKKWDWEKRKQWYYSRWPENQADTLGNVQRYWDK